MFNTLIVYKNLRSFLLRHFKKCKYHNYTGIAHVKAGIDMNVLELRNSILLTSESAFQILYSIAHVVGQCFVGILLDFSDFGPKLFNTDDSLNERRRGYFTLIFAESADQFRDCPQTREVLNNQKKRL